MLYLFGLPAASKTDPFRCAESRKQSIVAATCAMASRQLLFVADTDTGTHADTICLSTVISLLSCLPQIDIAQLSFTVLKKAVFLFSRRRGRRLLLTASENYPRPLVSKAVLFAHRARSAMPD